MKRLAFANSVGVAPGTTTVQLGNALPFVERSQWYPIDPFTEWQGRLPLGQINRSRIRWDIIGVVGGGSLAIALAIGLVASAIGK